MHFSIPETFIQKNGGNSRVFTCYCVHINSTLHSTLRFRQFRSLHEQLMSEFTSLPFFPPRSLLPLTSSDIEERRVGLEKYLIGLSSDPRILHSFIFNGFFFGAQLETLSEKDIRDSSLSFDVYLCNDQRISLGPDAVLSQSDEVLEKVCSSLSLPLPFVYYFGLFIMIRNESNGEVMMYRKLGDIECPYISLLNTPSNSSAKVVLRRCYWDPNIDTILLTHKVSTNLLYIQTVSDIERNWILASCDVKRRLALLQSLGAKNDYMEIGKQLKYYGYIHFMTGLSSYPNDGTEARFLLGGNELIIVSSNGSNSGIFKVTKIKCWRLVTVSHSCELELSFEYFWDDRGLEWISIVSPQAIQISLFLQSMIEELLRKKSQIPIKMAGEKSMKTEYVFRRKDGLSIRFPIRTPIPSNEREKESSNWFLSHLLHPKRIIFSKEQKSDAVNMKETYRSTNKFLFQNEAYGVTEEAHL